MPQLAHLRKTLLSSLGVVQASASATIYREGASVSGAQAGTSPLTVTVRALGKVTAGDTVFINSTTSTTYAVSSVTSTTVVLAGFSGTLSLANNDRLTPSNAKPTIYSDDQGQVTLSNPVTSSSLGLAECYIEHGTYDMVIVPATGSATSVTVVVPPSSNPAQIRFADEYNSSLSTTAGIQEAVDDLPSAGGIVKCSAKTYSMTTSVWLHSGVHLEGAGAGATILKRANGSISDSSPATSGAVINLGPKGSNGTQFSSGNTGSDISISNLTMDGNQSNMTLTSTSVGPMGLWALWTSGLKVHNVRVINTLQTAYYLGACKDIAFSNISADTVGQWSVSSDRNAISLHNGASSTFTNQGTITNFYFKNVGDEAITLDGAQGLAVSNGSVDGCDFGIEFTSGSPIVNKDCSFSNITFRNGLDFGITFNSTLADSSNISFTDLNFDFHSTLHDGGVIYMSSTLHNISDVRYNNITAKNINSKDTTSRNWIDCQAANGKHRNGLHFSGLNFNGLASTRTGDVGVTFRGLNYDIFISDSFFTLVAGVGIFLDDSTATSISNVHFDNVYVSGCTANGITLRNNGAANSIFEIYFNECTTFDCNGQNVAGSYGGWYLEASFAGSSIHNIYFNNCRSYRTNSSFHLYGLTMAQSAGTLGPVSIVGCDFSGCQTDWFLKSGTLTDIQFRPPNRRGTDIVTAATIAIPPDGNTFHVTGSTNITNGITVNPWDNGRLVPLIFEGAPTVSDTGTSKLAGNFAAAGATNDVDTLTIICDGTNWIEVARSTN